MVLLKLPDEIIFANASIFELIVWTEITITVATTLWNKLIKVWPSLYGSEQLQLYGLTGAVTLTYVKDVVF
jgi:hypothetical protein